MQCNAMQWYVLVCLGMYVCIYAWMHACMDGWMYAWMYVCMVWYGMAWHGMVWCVCMYVSNACMYGWMGCNVM